MGKPGSAGGWPTGLVWLLVALTSVAGMACSSSASRSPAVSPAAAPPAAAPPPVAAASTPPAAASAPGPGASRRPSVATGSRAPAFTVTTLDGQSFGLDQQVERGRATAVFVMATWCTTCIGPTKQLGELANAYRERGLDVLVLDVDPKETPADLVRFRDRFKGGDHLWAVDQGSRITLQYQVRALETLIVIDKTGRIVYRDPIPRHQDGLRQLLEGVLG